jgi:hypothetical protein
MNRDAGRIRNSLEPDPRSMRETLLDEVDRVHGPIISPFLASLSTPYTAPFVGYALRVNRYDVRMTLALR